MKLLKALTIVLFSLFLSFSVVYAQENSTADSKVNNQLQNDNNGNASGSGMEKTVSNGKTEKETVTEDSADNRKVPVIEKKNESRKAVNKRASEKKEIPVPAVVKEENSGQNKFEGDLLLINEGNFKYKRIPGIILPEIKPESAVANIPVDAPKSGQDKPSGFLGLSKTVSDIIVKGGVLLLILLVFILYKSRMSHPGSKSSKKRNVLNSYRK